MDEIIKLNSLVMEYTDPSKPYQGELIVSEHSQLLEEIDKVRMNQINRIKKKETPSRSSLLFLNIVSEFRLLSFLLVDIYQFERKRISDSEDN